MLFALLVQSLSFHKNIMCQSDREDSKALLHIHSWYRPFGAMQCKQYSGVLARWRKISFTESRGSSRFCNRKVVSDFEFGHFFKMNYLVLPSLNFF